ncbi:MAG: hypothetical protein IH576_01965 [Deltaproteobacteria bacterium]|nr:hypothetical protein [Deltaproteobacteria bacterium]
MLVVAEMVVVGPTGTTVILRAKLADPSSGRVLARAQTEATGAGRQFPGKFPAAFRSLTARASKNALEGMGLVR